ncbi:uncharacterized protein V6R79_023134 [Siganus canaliculatus]
MEGNLQGARNDVATTHVKTEAVDENSSALVLGSREPPAPSRDTACSEGGGGDQTAEELQAATTGSLLLYPVSTDRFFTASGDGKTYLKIAPASAMPPAPSEKTLPSSSDFSSKAVLCLIEAVGHRWGLYETRERPQLFQSVQEEMASKGHVLPVEKIRRKWNNLIVTYKRVKDRSRETGHAKTSWEFFDLMDATLCDTVGTQIINSKRNKGGGTVSAPPGPLAKVAAKPAIVCSNGAVEAAGPAAISSQILSCPSAVTSVTTAAAAQELKPLIVLNSDMVTTGIHPATVVTSPSFITSTCSAETASTSPSLCSITNPDLSTSHFLNHKAPSFPSGVAPFHLSNTAPHGNNQNLLSISSSFSSSPSCLSSPVTTSMSARTVIGAEGQSQKRNQDQGALFQEILKRQEEQVYLDRVARRRVEARERRRERREVRMVESLGRIATALELLSSKQDTVIALLQRLADRK